MFRDPLRGRNCLLVPVCPSSGLSLPGCLGRQNERSSSLQYLGASAAEGTNRKKKELWPLREERGVRKLSVGVVFLPIVGGFFGSTVNKKARQYFVKC